MHPFLHEMRKETSNAAEDPKQILNGFERGIYCRYREDEPIFLVKASQPAWAKRKRFVDGPGFDAEREEGITRIHACAFEFVAERGLLSRNRGTASKIRSREELLSNRVGNVCEDSSEMTWPRVCVLS